MGTVPSPCAPGHPCTFELQQSQFWVAALRRGGCARAHPSSRRVREAAALRLGTTGWGSRWMWKHLWSWGGASQDHWTHIPHPTLSTGVFAKLTDLKETWLQQRGGILIHMALEAKFLSWPWRVGVELFPSSAAVPLAQGTPKSICCAMGGLGGWRDLSSNRLKGPRDDLCCLSPG